MAVITLEGLVPIPRYDGKSFVNAEIFEGPTSDGPWTSIEVIAMVADPDPSNPQPRNLTTENATLEEGWYYVVFSDVDGDMMLPTTPMHDIDPIENPGYLPVVKDVADYLRARTKDRWGNEVGTFTEDTRPTTNAVISIISKAGSDVASLVDYDIPEGAWEIVRDLIALGAAMRIELSYWPEQVGSNRSPYDQLKELYDSQLERLYAAVERERAEAGGETASALSPRHSFPVDAGGMIGWGTRW